MANESKKDDKIKPNQKEKKTVSPEISDKVHVDFEPNIGSLYISMDECFEILASDPESVDLQEVLSVGARIRKRQQIRRYRSRMKIARRRSMRRRANTARISTRARRSALGAVKRKLSGGRSSANMSYSERARVEKLAARRKSLVKRQARRMVIQKRAIERRRMTGRR